MCMCVRVFVWVGEGLCMRVREGVRVISPGMLQIVVIGYSVIKDYAKRNGTYYLTCNVNSR